jgi:ABC-type polysaccharide/polyol phosphate transport system ATPase subunit
MLDAEEKLNAEFDKKLAQEEVWIRQGIKARRTRNEGRVRALEAMRQERQARQARLGNVHMQAQEAERSGKLVVEAENVGYRYDEQWIVRDFSTIIQRGDRIGIIGPNGVGKTTLLRLLLGQLAPTSGKIHLGTKLEVAYFDQLRAQLEEEKSVLDNLAGGREKITVNGADRHVISYLQDFLFAPERARTPVKALSGGERNRLLLARLFANPSNLLVHRRTDQRSGCRNPGPAGGTAAGLPGHPAAGQPRPRLPRPGGDQFPGVRRRGQVREYRRRLQRLAAPASRGDVGNTGRHPPHIRKARHANTRAQRPETQL